MAEEIKARGAQALALATQLLQRARLADPDGGIWEAADVRWWWRRPRASDAVDQPFWLDDQGPVAGVLMTSWRDDRWQCDPVVVASVADIDPARVWAHARDLIALHARGVIEVKDRPVPRPPAEGFTIVDRALRASRSFSATKPGPPSTRASASARPRPSPPTKQLCEAALHA